LQAVVDRRVELFGTIVHSDHGMPADVSADFGRLGRAWCEEKVPGSTALLDKYEIALPDRIEQHDLTEAARLLAWRPQFGIADYLADLRDREDRGEDIRALWAPGQIPAR
jgi:hypothetical protein